MNLRFRSQRLLKTPVVGQKILQLRNVKRRQQHQTLRQLNCVMLHTGRCGSTVLGDMLIQRGDIAWDGEVFERTPSEYLELPPAVRAKIYLDAVQHRQAVANYGLEIKYLQDEHLHPALMAMPLEQALALLKAQGFDRFIVLHRRNHLRRALSVEVSRQKRQWRSVQVATQANKVILSAYHFQTRDTCMPLVDYFRSMDAQQRQLETLLADEQALYLTYEDDVEPDVKIGYQRVCDFLSLPKFEPEVKLQKMNPFPLTESVINWGEVRAALEHTEYAWMVADATS